MLNDKILQVDITVDEYIKIFHEKENWENSEGSSKYWNSKYWKLVPKYVFAQCPICKKKYTESIDTYTIRGWNKPGNGDTLYHTMGLKNRCKHFVVTQYFINFNGIEPVLSPTEFYQTKQFNSEVPHVMGILLSDDTDSYAVMHSLPICRIEGEKFMPRYTVYIITYFSPEEKVKELKKKLAKWGPEYTNRFELLIWPPDNVEGDTWWDLNKWVKAGKLFWFEPDNRRLTLRKEPIDTFPYKNISGRKIPYFETVPLQKPKYGFISRFFLQGKKQREKKD